MRKVNLTLFAALAALALSVAPVAADAGDDQMIMVMKHACSADIQSEADFEAVELAGEGATNPVAALVNTVLACPTVVNPGDSTSDGIKADAAGFTFTVESSAGEATPAADTTALKLCESDLELDANGDGNISDDVCLDVSHRAHTGVSGGPVTVTETDAPDGFRFGTLRLTPTEIDGNNDAASLVAFADGVIELDTTDDEDGMVMLHVYNFADDMPDSSTALGTDSQPTIPVAPLLALTGVIALLGAGLFLRSTRARG